MKARRIQTSLVKKDKKLSLIKGNGYIIFYVQEGKRKSYYSGKLIDKKIKKSGLSQVWFFRESDRSMQSFFLQSPSPIFIKGL
jgi:hypothetical protein